MYYTWAGGVVFTFFFHSSLSGLCVLEGCVSVCMCVCMCVFYSPCCGIGNSELEHLPSHKLSVASSWPHTFASCSFSKWAVKRTPSTSAVRHIHVAAAGSAWKVKLTGFFFYLLLQQVAFWHWFFLWWFFFACVKCPNLLAWLDLSLPMQPPSCLHLGGMI